MPDYLWTPVAAGLLTLLCGVLGLASHQTLLVALGGFRPTLHDAGAVVVGVLIVAAGGEALRLVHARAGGAAAPERAASGNANRGN